MEANKIFSNINDFDAVKKDLVVRLGEDDCYPNGMRVCGRLVAAVSVMKEVNGKRATATPSGNIWGLPEKELLDAALSAMADRGMTFQSLPGVLAAMGGGNPPD